MTKKIDHTKEKVIELFEALTEISKMQADIIKAIQYDGHSIAQIAVKMRKSVDRIRNEEAAAYRNLFHLAIGDPDRTFFDDDPREKPGK